jgi:hypothetical protein
LIHHQAEHDSSFGRSYRDGGFLGAAKTGERVAAAEFFERMWRCNIAGARRSPQANERHAPDI